MDDNREFREYLASKLAENYAILMAPTGVEALKILKESDVDMLLTDISHARNVRPRIVCEGPRGY